MKPNFDGIIETTIAWNYELDTEPISIYAVV